jgi:hypothetical protein
MSNIKTMQKALSRSRAIVTQQTLESEKLSRDIAKLIRAEMIRNVITLKRLSEKSDIPMSRIVNWLCGSSTHCIPLEVISILWKAASTSDYYTKSKKK